jgi:GMP synthase-like glutamine amidotransferase
MRIHHLQHVPFEGLGVIADWAESKKHPLSCTQLYDGGALPPVDAFDCLIVTGGPMGVHEEGRYPWLASEKRFLEQAIKQDRSVLGICLGAQLLAQVLGARVYANSRREIGWLPIRWTPEAARHALAGSLPDPLLAFHWHGDTFDIPEGAIHLAESEACRNQAFAWGIKTLGLQFHLEVKRGSIEELMRNCAHEIAPEPYIQSSEEMLRGEERYQPVHDAMRTILERLEVAGDRNRDQQKSEDPQKETVQSRLPRRRSVLPVRQYD